MKWPAWLGQRVSLAKARVSRVSAGAGGEVSHTAPYTAEMKAGGQGHAPDEQPT
nr:hypothetical protein [Deltaproteobacteria bacterium]